MNASTGMSSPSSSTTPGGFAGDVFGQQPHEIDRVLSRLIQDNYDVADARRGEPSPGTDLPGTWARMDDAAVRAVGIDPALLHDAMTGFDASLYRDASRSEEHTSEYQPLMRISYAVFCLKQKNT